MVAGRGFAQLITEGQIITFVSEGFATIGGGSFLMLPMPVVIALVMLLITHLVVRYTALGLFIEAIGANVRSSAYAGIGTKVVTIAVYMWCGLCAAIAGLIVTADIRGADANNAGLWLELDAILAVVIGGTSLFGGRFSLALSVVGALIIQAMNTGILLSGYPPEYNLIVKAIVVLAVLLAQSPVLSAVRAIWRAKA
jgi:simple sugar transport system permease protein